MANEYFYCHDCETPTEVIPGDDEELICFYCGRDDIQLVDLEEDEE